jgi:CelD/BcsL family acetyltransferase involved in cellulose biosynthesis
MLGCQHEGCFHCTDIGIDPDCAKWTADSILQIEVLADLYNRDNRPDVFDFSTGSGDHEARFGNREQEEVNLLLLPRTLRHAILAGAYRRLDGMADIARFAADRTGVGRGLKKSVRRLAGAGSESSPS